MLNPLLILIGVLALQQRGATAPFPLPEFLVNGAPQQPQGNPQQALPPGTATLDGIVVAADTTRPVARASVEMRRAECNSTTSPETVVATSGDDGKFSFKNLHAGNWCIGASHPSGVYTPTEYAQRGNLGRGLALTIADNQQVTGIRLAMPRTGSISGRVLDSDGEPMGHARVQALEAFYQEGQRRLYILNVVQANDLGEFSLFWLPPGQYYVSAVAENPLRQQLMYSVSPPGNGGHRSDAISPVVNRKILESGEVVEDVYAPVYYGGGADPRRAQPIDVRAGSTTVIDLSFAGARIPSFHIRGRAINGVTGQPATGAQLRLTPRDWTSTAVVPYASADNNGDFDIAGVTPGSYVLYVNGTTRDPSAPANPANLSAATLQLAIAQGLNLNTGGAMPIGIRIPLEMGNSHIEDMKVTLTPGYAITGEFLFEGTLANDITPQLRSSLRVTVSRDPEITGAQAGGAAATIPANSPDNTFRLQNLSSGDYRTYVLPLFTPFLRAAPAISEALKNAYVKSIRLGNADVLADGLHLSNTAPDARLQIVLATGSKLEGTVTNDRQEVSANSRVALVPDYAFRRRADLYRSGTTDSSGKFRIQGVPPGNYKIFAWEDIPDGAWQDEETLRAYEGRGKAVRVGEGGQSTVDLVVIPPGRQQ